ncbi:MAG: hypothetical protein IRY94_02715 [Rhodospirillaceae bacterium]|nr:hypothetical protein [Rhodospirillaceae bacterium]
MAYQATRITPGRVVRRIFIEGKLYFAMGRFRTVRRGYSVLRRLQQTFVPPAAGTGLTAESLFSGHVKAEVLERLRRDGIYVGLQLPPAMVEEVVTFARAAPLTRWAEEESFLYGDVRDGRLPNGEPVVVGSVRDPEACPTVARIKNDPLLREFVSAYLGYVPQRSRVVLFWNFASNLSEAERSKVHQANNYHYDVDGFNFLYVQFFMTDVDEGSGLHIIIKGSHRKKPMHLLLSSVKQPDEAIHAYYGVENECIIQGKAGFGFIEDTSSFHKAQAPTKRDRLLLQFVYY